MHRFLIVFFIAGCTELLPSTPGGGGKPPTIQTDAGTADAGSADAGSAEGDPCKVSRDCQANLSCPSSSHVCERCVPGESCGDGGTCFESVYGPNSVRVCGYGGDKDPCIDAQDCQANRSCVAAIDNGGTWKWCRGECLDGQFCDGGVCHADGGALSCSPGQNGDPCRTSADCVAGGTCFTKVSSSGAASICTDGQTGSPCSDNVQCHSGTCTDTVTAGGVVSSCN